MNEHILKAIDEEIARLQQARSMLARDVAETAKPRRTMSVKARRAIGEAQRRRWEKVHSLKKDLSSVALPARNENVAG